MTEIKTFEQLKETYSPLGITHFKLSETYDAQALLNFLIEYFVKEEYREIAFKDFHN